MGAKFAPSYANLNMVNIQKALQRAKRNNREDLLKGRGNTTRKQEWSEKVALTTRYSKQFFEMSKIVKKYLPILYGDEHFFKVLSPGISIIPKQAHSLFKANCQKQDLGPLTLMGNYRCGSRRCITCKHLKISKKFKSTVTGREFDIKGYTNCNTTFVIYLITRLRCQKQYVGCTSRKLKERAREHMSHSIWLFLQCCISRRLNMVQITYSPTMGTDSQ
ncbi:hypothetical protein XELAEV_18035039mg [Xenopus laevis]|uniref:GIY-YIG domain-containing protein n=1 Tax=Xenopus laevis TaxID=8355 RepID=A0A974HC41_XENLA|nr:hypothetical protein XELAEV_18035039mg [Xenopus laevis]